MEKPDTRTIREVRSRCFTIIISILCLLLTSTALYAQSLTLESSYPSHMSSGVALDTTISFTFNVAVDEDELYWDQFNVIPYDAITVHNRYFTEDFKTAKADVTHEPDTDYTWFFLNLPGLEGEVQEQYQVVNYTTASETSDYTIKGALSFTLDPWWMAKPVMDTQTIESSAGFEKRRETNQRSGTREQWKNAGDCDEQNRINKRRRYFGTAGHFDGNRHRHYFGDSAPEADAAQSTWHLDKYNVLLEENDEPIEWGLSMVWLLDDLDWMEDPDSGGPMDALVNAGVTDPETGEYLIENVRPGEYYLLALLSEKGVGFDVYAVGVYEENHEPALVTVQDGSLTGIDITLRGWLGDLPEPIDAEDALVPAVNKMADEDPQARPIGMWGEDSGLFDDYDDYDKKVLDYYGNDQRMPSGKSYFWEVIFLNDADSMAYINLVMGPDVVVFEPVHLSEMPPEHLPPIPLSELKSLPDTYISSASALEVAMDNGLDTLLIDHTAYDSWDYLDYELGGFYFEFPGLLDEDSPVFWWVLYGTFEWDYLRNIFVFTETSYLIDSEDGTLLGIDTERHEIHPEMPVDFDEAFPLAANIMDEENEDAWFILSFGSEDFYLPDFPSGMSMEWMLVWYDTEEEAAHIFNTRGFEIISREMMYIADVPDDERPDLDLVKSIDEVPVGSQMALTAAMDHGLRDELFDVPEDGIGRIQYNLHSLYTEYPEILDEDSNPFWDIDMQADVFNEYWESTYRIRSNHIIDAYTGEHLGSRSVVTTEKEPAVPSKIVLHQNYPNPFNPATRIRWEMDTERHVTLTVFDLLGRVVGTLTDESWPAGVHSIPFDATGLSSGVYIYRLEAGDVMLTRKMSVVK